MLKQAMLHLRRKARSVDEDVLTDPFQEAFSDATPDETPPPVDVSQRRAFGLFQSRKRKSRADFVTVASTADLLDLQAKRVLVGGALLATSTQSDAPPKGFTSLAPRDGSTLRNQLMKKGRSRLFLALHPMLQDLGRQRFAFLPDAYLAWGLRQKKGFYALIGGIEKAEDYFQVDVMVFNDGILLDLFDMTVPGRDDFRFAAAAQVVLETIRGRYASAQIALAAPLSDWNMPTVVYEGASPLKRLSFKPLERSGTSRRDFVLPGAIALTALCFYGGAIVSGWNRYSSEVKNYDQIAGAAELKSLGGIDADYIAVMTQRRLFMEAPRRQDLMPARMLEIVKGIGIVPGVQIHEMRLPAPSIGVAAAPGILVVPEGAKEDDATSERQPDALLRLSVPKTAAPALEQARELMVMLRGSTGMTLRLIHRGWQDDNARRTFTIEGFLNG